MDHNMQDGIYSNQIYEFTLVNKDELYISQGRI